MNTMYRNEHDKVREGGYEQVKKVFENSAPSILDKERHTKQEQLNKEEFVSRSDKIIEQLCEKSVEDDKKIQRALDEAVEDITSTETSAEQTLEWPKAKDNLNNMTAFDNMPKALLHVHNKVGLSVDELFELFGEINGKAKDDKEKIGFAVKNEKVEYVMYRGQYKVLEKKAQKQEKCNFDISGCSFEEYKATDDNTKYKKDLQFDGSEREENVWKKFNEIFARMEPVFQIKDFYKGYHEKLFEKCNANNIKYVELRVGFENLVKLECWKSEMLTSLREGFRMEDYFYHRDMMLSTTPDEPNAEFLQVIYDAAKNRTDKKKIEIEVKVILTANRNYGEEGTLETAKNKIYEKLDTAIAIKNGMAKLEDTKKNDNIADMVIGFDLVNEEKEDEGRTNDYAPILYAPFGKKGKINGRNEVVEDDICEYWNGKQIPTDYQKLSGKKRIDLMRFFFHDGESRKKIKNTDDNAITGPICSRHRIGHGFKMGAGKNFKVGDLESENRAFGNQISDYILYGYSNDMAESSAIANYPVERNGKIYTRIDAVPEPVIELCPISNYMLGYVESFETHHAIKLMEKGILAVICNDDPQIFDNPGLSYDYAVMYAALKNRFRSSDMPYKLLKLSAFLGFFYQEMSKHYYRKEELKTEAETAETKWLWVVNDNMKVGSPDSRKDDNDEHGIFNNALVKFNEAWNTYAGSFSKPQSSPTAEGQPQ